ncbi:MAG: serine/threonine protein kinase [Spirochaetaceae bacterium]
MAKVPESIGKYKISELIAQGGMGAVYKGVHPTLERPVILKKLTLRGNPDFVERFRREARLLMDFRHDNIVDVYDHFKEGRTHYIVLEYIDGLSLEQLIRRERYLPNEMALYILYQACRALKYAHDRGVVHRDIKPANILLSKRGEVKLADFGIATSSEDSESGLTREGMTLGSPAYMAPEQFENTKNVDLRADIYSIGVMLYEMVTGKKPYPGGFSADLVSAIQKGKHPPPKRYNPKVNRPVRKIIKKSMHPKRARRFQDLQEVLTLLEGFFRRRRLEPYRLQLKQAVGGKTVEPLTPRRRSPIKKALVTIPAILVLLGAAGGILYSLGYYHEWIEPDEYGALSFQVEVDGSYKPAEDYYIRAWLYTDTGDNAEEMDMEPLRFTRVTRKEGETLRFRSRKLYLPEDEYRVKLQIENTLHWKSFYLEPRTGQRGNINTREGRTLEFYYGEQRDLPLEVDFFVQDRSNWKNITGLTSIEVEMDGTQQPWSPELAESLQTGRVYRFHFSAPGYNPKTFSLLIRPEQHVLVVNPRLSPIEE